MRLKQHRLSYKSRPHGHGTNAIQATFLARLQHVTLLDVKTVRDNRYIRNTQKTFLHDLAYLHAVEMAQASSGQQSLQTGAYGILTTPSRHYGPEFVRQEEEIPSGSTN